MWVLQHLKHVCLFSDGKAIQLLTFYEDINSFFKEIFHITKVSVIINTSF